MVEKVAAEPMVAFDEKQRRVGLSWGQQWQGLGKVGTMHKFWNIID